MSSCGKCPLAPAAAPCSVASASASARVQDQSSQERTGPRVPNALSSGVGDSVVESMLSTACRLLELAEIMAGSLDGLGYA